jgi:protein SCO1/2
MTERAPHGALSFRLRVGFMVLLLAALATAGAKKSYRRSVEVCTLPDVVLLNQDAKEVRLQQLVESGVPVVVTFFYASDLYQGPRLAEGFAHLQTRIGDDPRKLRLVSITIDPVKDTPQVMKDCALWYQAKANWDFLTGTKAEVERAMHGFNTFIPDTASWVPLNLIYSPKTRKWVRLFGFLSPSDLLKEFRKAGIR